MQVLLKFVTTQAAGEVTKFALTHFFYTGLVAATAGSFMLLSFAQVAPWPSMCARSQSELPARSCMHGLRTRSCYSAMILQRCPVSGTLTYPAACWLWAARLMLIATHATYDPLILFKDCLVLLVCRQWC